MKNNKKIVTELCALLIGATGVFAASGMSVSAQETAVHNPNELILGMFFTSNEDRTDSLYVSFNGTNFERISIPYEDLNPADRSNNYFHLTASGGKINCLHDPGLQYYNNYFWTMSGYQANGGFRPMLAYSPDMVNWSWPNSGGTTDNTNSTVELTQLPYGKEGKRDNADFECAAPDFFIDDDGTAWIVACLGYYGAMHNDPYNDVMSPYIMKMSDIRPGTEEIPTTPVLKDKKPLGTYSKAYPMKLSGATSTNYIDASLYKENGKYYLSIKRDGTVCEIWQTDEIGLDSTWTKVCSNVVTGYEGPSLTRFDGTYLTYTDKLAGNDGKKGIYVIESDALSEGWTNNHAITTKTISGTAIENRHGSVITVTDPNVISKVMELYREQGGIYTDDYTDIELNSSDVEVNVKKSYSLKANISPSSMNDKAIIRWSSSDESVATVDRSGNVTGIKEGQVVITAQLVNGAKTTCNVTVTNYEGIAKADDGSLYYMKDGERDSSYTGLGQYIDGKWYYVKNGKHVSTFSGVSTKSDGTKWYVKNGVLDNSYTGIAKYSADGIYYYFQKGEYNTTYSGFATSTNEGLYYVKNGKWDKTYTGLAKNTDGKWYYAREGKYINSFTGVTTSTNGVKYYVTNGTWNKKFVGLAKYSGDWYYFEGGKHNTTYTGMAKSTSGGLFYVKNGEWCKTYTGLAKYTDGKWYYVKDGKHISSYIGTTTSTNGVKYYVTNGTWNKKYNGLAKYSGTWYYFSRGKYDISFTGLTTSTVEGLFYANKGEWDKSYTGLVKYKDDKWYYVREGKHISVYEGVSTSANGKKYYVTAGIWNKKYTGLAKYNGVWYYFKGGKEEPTFEGIVKSANGESYYVKDGVWAKEYSGTYREGGVTYKIVNGKVK